MNNLKIQIDDNRKSFLPGEKITGQLSWQLSTQPDFIQLSLYWQARGKCFTDTGIAETLKFENPGSFGNESFSMTLPSGPYSFCGNLFSIEWKLELAMENGGKYTEEDIVMSANKNIINCKNLISDSAAK